MCKMFKKVIIFFLIVLCQSCIFNSNTSNSNDISPDILKMFSIIIKYQNLYFSSEKAPVRNKLSIFFSAKSCPSCIIDLNSYVNTMKRNYNVDVDFYTNLDNENLGGIDKIIPSLKKISVDTIFSNLEYPIIFQTNDDGRIINCMPVNSSYLYISFDYIKKYALDHPFSVK